MAGGSSGGALRVCGDVHECHHPEGGVWPRAQRGWQTLDSWDRQPSLRCLIHQVSSRVESSRVESSRVKFLVLMPRWVSPSDDAAGAHALFRLPLLGYAFVAGASSTGDLGSPVSSASSASSGVISETAASADAGETLSALRLPMQTAHVRPRYSHSSSGVLALAP